MANDYKPITLLCGDQAMKVFAAHDVDGNIAEIVVSPPNAPAINPVAKPGQLVTEIDPYALGIDLSNPATYTDLGSKIKDLRLDTKAVKARVIKK